MKTALPILAILASLLIVARTAHAEPMPAEAAQSVAAVRKHIDKLGGEGSGEIIVRSDGGVAAVFPNHHIVVVRFRQFPVARVLPDGLQASNVFAVDRAGKIELLPDAKALEKFFQVRQAPITNDEGAWAILAAWLTLTQEFHQDGMLKFEVMEKEFAVAGNRSKASGRAVVMQGGNGELKAELEYDKDGRLSRVVEEASIRPGPRPICQATKLLDSDPVVRRMAGQDLLIMGLSARGYLMEQRRLAAPELRTAIDRVWAQIEKNGW